MLREGGNPSSALIGPLALLALVFGRKKTRNKWDNIVIIAVLCLAVGMSLVGCGGGGGGGGGTPTTPPGNGNSGGSGNDPGDIPTSQSPTGTLKPTCTPTPQVPTSTISIDLILAGGMGADLATASPTYANQKALYLYENWANNKGIHVIPINFETTKVAQRNRIIDEIKEGHSYIIIGHSAGADSAILTLNEGTHRDSIRATVLLDPSFTASGVDAPNNQITTMYESVAGSKVLLTGTELGMGKDYLKKYVNAEYRYGKYNATSYNSLSDWSAYSNVTDHTAMAIDPVVSNTVIHWLEGLGL